MRLLILILVPVDDASFVQAWQNFANENKARAEAARLRTPSSLQSPTEDVNNLPQEQSALTLATTSRRMSKNDAPTTASTSSFFHKNPSSPTAFTNFDDTIVPIEKSAKQQAEAEENSTVAETLGNYSTPTEKLSPAIRPTSPTLSDSSTLSLSSGDDVIFFEGRGTFSQPIEKFYDFKSLKGQHHGKPITSLDELRRRRAPGDSIFGPPIVNGESENENAALSRPMGPRPAKSISDGLKAPTESIFGPPIGTPTSKDESGLNSNLKSHHHAKKASSPNDLKAPTESILCEDAVVLASTDNSASVPHAQTSQNPNSISSWGSVMAPGVANLDHTVAMPWMCRSPINSPGRLRGHRRTNAISILNPDAPSPVPVYGQQILVIPTLNPTTFDQQAPVLPNTTPQTPLQAPTDDEVQQGGNGDGTTAGTTNHAPATTSQVAAPANAHWNPVTSNPQVSTLLQNLDHRIPTHHQARDAESHDDNATQSAHTQAAVPIQQMLGPLIDIPEAETSQTAGPLTDRTVASTSIVPATTVDRGWDPDAGVTPWVSRSKPGIGWSMPRKKRSTPHRRGLLSQEEEDAVRKEFWQEQTAAQSEPRALGHRPAAGPQTATEQEASPAQQPANVQQPAIGQQSTTVQQPTTIQRQQTPLLINYLDDSEQDNSAEQGTANFGLLTETDVTTRDHTPPSPSQAVNTPKPNSVTPRTYWMEIPPTTIVPPVALKDKTELEHPKVASAALDISEGHDDDSEQVNVATDDQSEAPSSTGAVFDDPMNHIRLGVGEDYETEEDNTSETDSDADAIENLSTVTRRTGVASRYMFGLDGTFDDDRIEVQSKASIPHRTTSTNGYGCGLDRAEDNMENEAVESASATVKEEEMSEIGSPMDLESDESSTDLEDDVVRKYANLYHGMSFYHEDYGTFDVTDRDRGSLQTNSKVKIKVEPDSDNEQFFNSQRKKDRTKKKARKEERNRLRQQGQLGRKSRRGRQKTDLWTANMPFKTFKNKIRHFLEDDGSKSLILRALSGAQREAGATVAKRLDLKPIMHGYHKDVGSMGIHKTKKHVGVKIVGMGLREIFEEVKGLWNGKQESESAEEGDAIVVEQSESDEEANPIGVRQSFGSQRNRNGTKSKLFYREGELIAADAIGMENRGYGMMRKLGWEPGTAIGAENNKGPLEPIPVKFKKSKRGL